MIIRGYICLYRYGNLILIQQNLNQHILVVHILTIEDKLQIGCHRHNIIQTPSLNIHIIQIIYLLVETVDTHQTNQRHHHGIMTETEGGTRFRQSYTTVSLTDDIMEQITLRIRHFAIGKRIHTEMNKPP